MYQLAIGIMLMGTSMFFWSLWYRGHFTFAVAGLFNLPFDFGLLMTVNALLIGCRPLAAIVCAWPLQMSGLMCYSLYLWHGQIISKYRVSVYTIPTYIGYLFLTYLVSWLSYRYIEFGSVRHWKSLLPSQRKPETLPVN
jgi:peptidoglycan/LPS O-acetylase OafA/YrhL